MARFRRMLAPITTLKHYVQFSSGTDVSGAITLLTAVNSVVAPAAATTADVKQGSVVKAVYFELWVQGLTTGNHSQFTMTIEKLPTSAVAQTFTNSQNLSAYVNKKNILYTTQGIVGNLIDGSPAVPIIRNWVKIPKGKQRMGLGDRVVLNISAVGDSLRRCGMSTYKEYT